MGNLVVSIFGRSGSSNVDDRRTGGASVGWWLTGLGGGVVGAGALAWGLGGVQWTLCQVGLGPCGAPVSIERKAQLDEYVAVILGDTERVWGADFAAEGETYAPTTMVLHDTQVTSLCGAIQAGQGPAYCIRDRNIYVDLAYFSERVPETGAEGDFPPAFIIAHEVGHHIQNLTGTFDEKFLGRLDDPAIDPNRLMVRLELQADCLAGVWARKADDRFGLLQQGDFDEAVRAAELFGDDAVQARRDGLINTAAFTHGSGEQRARWLKAGFEGGERDACDTWTPAFESL